MTVLGIDPGSNKMGISIFDEDENILHKEVLDLNSEITKIHANDLNKDSNLAKKYEIIFNTIDSLIKEHKVTLIGIEDQFASVNKDTFKKISRVAAIPILLAGIHNIPYRTFAPASWRKTLHGNGKVNKTFTREYVNEKYGLSLKKKHEDLSDSMGIGLAALKERKTLNGEKAE